MSDVAEKLAKALLGAVGENAKEDEVKHWLDMGYKPLNKILSGSYDRGLPQGRIVEIYGPSASGKTVLATQAMIAAQQAGGVAIFVDWERAFNATFAQEVGLKTDFPFFVYKRSATWESGNTEAMKAVEVIRKSNLLDPNAPIVVVFDSVAAAVPKSMIEKGIDELTMNDTTALARVTSTTLKAINQFVGEFGVTAIYLNQIRMKPGIAYGDPTTTPGGTAMEFYASIRMATGAKKLMEKTGSETEFIGRQLGITTKKNKLARPFREIDLRLIYGDDGRCGFDYIGSLVDHLVAIGALPTTAGGKQIVWDGKAYFKKALTKKLTEEASLAQLEALLPND